MSINRNETILGITGLQKYYGKNHVLKGIDLNIHRGEVVAIIGQSGSGKSTLLRCMNGLEEYQEGQIIYNGELTITSDPADAQEISRSIGMIFQQFNLFPHLTAIQNVMLAPSSCSVSALWKVTFWLSRCSSRSGSGTAATSIPRAFPADSSSAWP